MSLLTSSHTIIIPTPGRRRLKRPKNPNLEHPRSRPRSRFFITSQLDPLSTSPPLFNILSLNWVPPAIALASATAFAFSLRRNPVPNPGPNSNEWVLFTSPTPFNRFVLLRCPSVSFEGVEDVHTKLIMEERHYVRLDSGRVEEKSVIDDVEGGEEVEYERVCVGTKDGGVVSLDWPASLELRGERGLDTTVLIVPGTAEGSMEGSVKEFVKECLRRGLFPVVMNPRGCAGSPLTTARLFTAADSDDICSAIQFIITARPWSTLTGVGWGYGANMLTKYLAEAGEKTPLTAATCIDTPFDLDEATRTSPYSKLTGGLIDILKSNKELFQGRRKGFDVEKALAARSIRDFEKAISMVSYGLDTLEEFYANCSTRSIVGNLKIPVLFIQNDNGNVPLFSIPRGLIAENPFTSLLLCSCVASNVTAISWYQQVTIEWLAAVELGLLKGRHPLLQDMDVTINPSKGFALVEGRTFDTKVRLPSVLNLAEVDSLDAEFDPVKEMLTERDASAGPHLRSNPTSERDQSPDDRVLREMNGAVQQNRSVDANSDQEIESELMETDTGQVLQTAQVVINMLDVTMPGTLKEEEKAKVLAAVGNGETLMKALQDAVPEDVRGKLTTSVSEILQVQGKNLNLEGLLRLNQIANVSSGSKSKIKEDVSDTKSEKVDHSLDNKVSGDDTTNGNSDVNELGGEGAEVQPPEKSLKASDHLEPTSVDSHSDGGGGVEFQKSDDKLDSGASPKKVVQSSEFGDDGSETTAKLSSSSQNAGETNSVEAGGTQENRSEYDDKNEPDSNENNVSARVENHKGSSDEQSNMSSAPDIRPNDTSEAPASSISEGQLSEKGDDNNSSKDEKPVQPLPDQNKASDAKKPNFNVTQAFDALTGLDDSTQIAVNSVFGVIEDMITKLEEKQNENSDNKGNENHSAINGSVVEKIRSSSELQLKKQTKGEDQEDATDLVVESINGDDGDNNVEAKEIDRKMDPDVDKSGAETAEKPANISKTPLIIPTDPYAKAIYKEYIRKYILSKLQNVKSIDSDTATALFLRYVPEEGYWILVEQPGGTHGALSCNSKDRMDLAKLLAHEKDIIEPSYVIIDKERQEEPPEDLKEKLNKNLAICDNNLDESNLSIKTIVLDSLRVEVGRRLSTTELIDMEVGLAADMEEVAGAVFSAIQQDQEHHGYVLLCSANHEDQDCSRLDGNLIVEAIFKAVQNTSYLRGVLPVGVIVGSTLAALRKRFDVATASDSTASSVLDLDQEHINGSLNTKSQLLQKDVMQVPVDGINRDPILEKNQRREGKSTTSNTLDEADGTKGQSKILNRDTLVMGAVTAAIGASALLTSQQEDFMGSASSETSSYSEDKVMKKESVKLEAMDDNKHQSNIVTSLAEKAMSVAAPVVPTKGDGEVDHERVISVLAELGQRGGVLKLVGKLALLWGGLRGAMSLTDRLISFLRVADRPLLQRVLGFSCMVLVLWSPLLVPLLPTLFHNMATQNSSKIAELACIFGLYGAVTILIMQWGKRVRGYEDPLKQYGLNLVSSRKMQDFLIGLVGGVVLVCSIHSINALLGFASLSLPTNLSSSSLNLTTKFKAYGQLLLLAGRGLLMAAGVAFVEELLFRSWLLEEIAADLGYHAGIILSGFAFSLFQRSWLAIPGLWLFSICLAGTRLRKEGSLFIPIGLRTGIMTSTAILQTSGLFTYQPKYQLWVAGGLPFQPFSSIVGLLFALLLAVALYPRQPDIRRRVPRTIRA